ncbi:basic blue protein-like [Aegilops tauschii subsp. strangulata]|uniref:Chemocyanin n=1 Tax=Aegilops tauschii TaxID=37682 RepID=M8BWG7_AEGTA|nr:basic blue protein-like [Aegilops tauschii subsp. strangulata]
MARGTMVPTLLVLLLAIFCATTIAHSKEWNVGRQDGWFFSISNWGDDKPIKVGDVLDENSKSMFKYKAILHNVVQVSEEDYNACTASRPSPTYRSGNDHIKVTSSGRFFFICYVKTPLHCENGMKIAITVQ